MADTGAITPARAAANDLLVEGTDVRLAAETGLGMAKLQILAVDPDAWFEQALGLVPPSALTEIEPGPVAIAWLAPGEWLVTGGEADVERVRLRCAEAAGGLGLMVDITHARATFELSGAAARSILAAHCPLDFGNEAMPVGAAKRSMFSDTGFFISRRADRDGQPCFRLIFDQAMAGYAGRMLGATIAGAAL
ncbi:sarcosine oxidase subunit gamma [Sphingopyxis sp. OAS728]|uniref:sarcosine oxidase subunit gamma n=1 Tax=Sphingopyxis sp. OAS728 TaxID=2663823 RepID=UPI00178AF2FA|nr:sarcosine oxidase subunit gamma family protein [Sphingopyxis sp. OAS728]MBE1529937.1 sarcosine oxidase subunit gamma [Sphingopyxis sp. OAS728]